MKFLHLLCIKNVSVSNEVLHQPSENMLSIEGKALSKKIKFRSKYNRFNQLNNQKWNIYIIDTSNHLSKNTPFLVPSINIAAAKFQKL